jgi:hypothetical protein
MSENVEPSSPSEEIFVGTRVKLGFAVFIVSIAWPILIPVLPMLGVSAAATATITGVMVVAAELLLLAGAAIAGKQGFDYIKKRVFDKLKIFAPPMKVSPVRYRIGLILFAATLFFAWATPYFGHRIPGYETNVLTYAIAGDLILLISLFLLGGGFWEKLRSLFVHNATAKFPNSST